MKIIRSLGLSLLLVPLLMGCWIFGINEALIDGLPGTDFYYYTVSVAQSTDPRILVLTVTRDEVQYQKAKTELGDEFVTPEELFFWLSPFDSNGIPIPYYGYNQSRTFYPVARLTIDASVGTYTEEINLAQLAGDGLWYGLNLANFDGDPVEVFGYPDVGGFLAVVSDRYLALDTEQQFGIGADAGTGLGSVASICFSNSIASGYGLSRIGGTTGWTPFLLPQSGMSLNVTKLAEGDTLTVKYRRKYQNENPPTLTIWKTGSTAEMWSVGSGQYFSYDQMNDTYIYKLRFGDFPATYSLINGIHELDVGPFTDYAASASDVVIQTSGGETRQIDLSPPRIPVESFDFESAGRFTFGSNTTGTREWLISSVAETSYKYSGYGDGQMVLGVSSDPDLSSASGFTLSTEYGSSRDDWVSVELSGLSTAITSGQTELYASFDGRVNFDSSGFDWVAIELSTDGTDWHQVFQPDQGAQIEDNGWLNYLFRIPPSYLAAGTLRFRFMFHSDESWSQDPILIDNLVFSTLE